MASSFESPLQVWVGLECSFNRIQERYFDQYRRTGHDERNDDIDRIASLGVRAVRYAVSWERHLADPTRWLQTDERLSRLREFGIRPIVGLVHHGSGPPDTSLIDDAFPARLAGFAQDVARRYPWVDAYTPVNEPLTTARFSGLYGLWYPHARDDRSFVRAALTQLRATVLAMQAIRRVRPDAILVQTEDLGQVHAPPNLQYQAKFENERRWLTWDLLCGSLAGKSPILRYLRKHGAAAKELRWFPDNPCPPDLLGVNHYVTSERYLDDRLQLYPPGLQGGNDRHAYVDTEAVRVLRGGPAGAVDLLRQTWERYRLPIAVTEAHLGCTREEQLRWLWEIWRAARQVRGEGIDVRAVTAWSILGAYDWDSLITRESDSYEPGAFDVRSEPPRATAIASLIRTLAAGDEPDHPALESPGWWRRPKRLTVPPVEITSDVRDVPSLASGAERPAAGQTRTLLIVGDGSLACALEAACRMRALAHVRLGSGELDSSDPSAVSAALTAHSPWAVVNASGFHRVEAAEHDPERCRHENIVCPAVLASACASLGIRFVTFSTDLVFDGELKRPYREGDRVSPLNQYGSSHAEAERLVKATCATALIVRTGALFGPFDGGDFVSRMLRSLRGGQVFAAAEDLVTSPSYRPDVVDATLDLLIDGETGVCHLSGPESMSWAALAKRCAAHASLDPDAVQGRTTVELGWKALRPRFSALTSERFFSLPCVEAGLARGASTLQVPKPFLAC